MEVKIAKCFNDILDKIEIISRFPLKQLPFGLPKWICGCKEDRAMDLYAHLSGVNSSSWVCLDDFTPILIGRMQAFTDNFDY
jgi:hypothetical protein